MDTQLKGKRALVTGSTGDIGAGIALSLAREGASVALNGRNQEAAKRIASHITEQGATAQEKRSRPAANSGIIVTEKRP